MRFGKKSPSCTKHRNVLPCWIFWVLSLIFALDLLLVKTFFVFTSDEDLHLSLKKVRPEFTDTLAIKAGRHPIRSCLQDNFVPNDTYSSLDASMSICSGPNMSGKSTYLGQIALLQIMAQMGSFVPADYASFRLCDRLLSRMGSDDSLQSNASSFMLEMREMAFIFQNLSDSSLIIMDELGRGTSTTDGLAITIAICEALVKTKVISLAHRVIPIF